MSGIVRTRPLVLATMVSIARRFGYPSAGCSPALPASVSPKSFGLYDLGGRFCGVTVPNEGLRTLAMRTGPLPELDDQTEELVMIEGEEKGKLELHSGILAGVANQTPH